MSVDQVLEINLLIIVKVEVHVLLLNMEVFVVLDMVLLLERLIKLLI